ncbi:hypothetical protein I6A84_10970 [Frankia sp. CNm7]|uniref:DUF5709 domain-containing protein n=1 Tax=Frankia nepalensis TaxID=1836974 RepID=A0A937UR00_9ACTN|nr:hypothetical protein [Frankia nepalensis]MBL7495524.1 hypothetical protein [Frankia nepalensis]MBL7509805.1 hypothetical protein [Frankia nepalensis]MBL7518618.1 hypothetical protein [Frankia nepalensis]MBL7630628.1 hypothetical protein [Frankia nepalensis]
MTKPAEYRPDGVDMFNVLDDVPLTVEESLDSDDLGTTDAGLDPLDDSWDAPDSPSAETRQRPTANERLAGASLDEALAQEVPDVDPYLEAERLETGLVLDDDVEGVDTPFAESNPGPRLAGLVADDAAGLGEPLTARPVNARTLRRTGEAGLAGQGDGEAWPLAPEEDALHLD